MEEIRNAHYKGERPLFAAHDLCVVDTIFDEGESPLKESRDIALRGSMFKWKYPLWYAKHIRVQDCTWFEMARAGVWYTEDITVEDSAIEAPKNFRRCRGVTLRRVSFPNAAETLWHCEDVALEHVTASGAYFGMNSTRLTATDFTLYGNYCFDGARQVTLDHAKLLSKDAFWNSEDVTVRNSFISGEYLGWNSRNLTLEDCTIESLQGLCYIDRLTLRRCKLLNTTLAFEYSTVEADITGSVDSVLNPSGGTIRADRIGELILERDRVDPTRTVIICREQPTT